MKRNARLTLADHPEYPGQVGPDQMMRETDREAGRLLPKDIERTTGGRNISPRGLQKTFAGRRQTHATRRPFDKAMPQHVLKPAQAQRYRRL